MARVLVTGASGQLGQELGIALLNDGFEVIKASHDLLDITNDNQVSQVIEQLDIDVLSMHLLIPQLMPPKIIKF